MPNPLSGLARLVYLHPYTLIAVVFLMLSAVPYCSRIRSDWDEVYVTAASRLRAGEDIYQQGFVYPPINAVVALPGTAMPRLAGRIVAFGFQMLALLLCLWLTWRLAAGGRLEGEPFPDWREHAIWLFGLICGGFYALGAIGNQQNDLIIAALVLLGCTRLALGREFQGAILFGLAAGLKCTPLLWAAYLAWRRRYAAALLVPTVALAINLIPDVTHPREGPPRIVEWAGRYLVPMTGEKHDFGTWAAGIHFNQSLSGAINRAMVWEPAWTNGVLTPVPAQDRFHPLLVKAVVALVLSSFLAAAVYFIRRPGREDASLPATSLEFALVITLMPLLCPHSSKPHFCILLLPAMCLARQALYGKSWTLKILCLVIATRIVVHKNVVGDRMYDWLMWFGQPTLVAVLLFFGCGVALRRLRTQATSSPQTTSLRQAA